MESLLKLHHHHAHIGSKQSKPISHVLPKSTISLRTHHSFVQSSPILTVSYRPLQVHATSSSSSFQFRYITIYYFLFLSNNNPLMFCCFSDQCVFIVGWWMLLNVYARFYCFLFEECVCSWILWLSLCICVWNWWCILLGVELNLLF